MNIELKDLVTLIREIAAPTGAEKYDNHMVGEFVLVRCRDAGVHAGRLVSHHNRECVLEDSRRLWYWKPARGGLLSSVAQHGLACNDSIVGERQDLIHLTETCEISLCTSKAAESISAAPESHPDE